MTAYATALFESPKSEIVAEAIRQKERAEKAEAEADKEHAKLVAVADKLRLERADLAEARTVTERAIAMMCEDKCSRNCCSHEARIVLLLPAPATEDTATCLWTRGDDGYWRSGCGQTWTRKNGNPRTEYGRVCLRCRQPVELPAPATGKDGE